MIELKTQSDMDAIHENGRVLCSLFDRLETWMEPGMSTWDINQFCEDYITKAGCFPSCKGFEGYPAGTCISINEQVIHGIPHKEKIVRLGDIVSIDIVCDRKGNFFADSTRTYIMGEVPDRTRLLVRTTKECLDLAIEAAAKPGARMNDVSGAVFEHANQNGFGVVRDYCGHGVGFGIHEDPNVPNFVSPFAQNLKLREGLVIAIEPMINMGTHKINTLHDGWTVVTADRKPSAHFEHTIGITKNGVEVLTQM
ncbi:MAG: type I methionyl aminopeptidase [Sphaerochaetaceae bacterium]|jgi:methionyl aminopeptidase|nr:type I methionyl aminopeptidase [Sphaerochaetaceae bacterium]MDD4396837.1 type I methionyl aminopeptidase [Sphaerochaetaceae bacterium]